MYKGQLLLPKIKKTMVYTVNKALTYLKMGTVTAQETMCIRHDRLMLLTGRDVNIHGILS